MKFRPCLCLLPVLLLCPVAASAAPGSAHAASAPASSRTTAMVQKLKRLADGLLVKNATIQSVSALIGPKKRDWNGSRELTPTDPDFSQGSVSINTTNNVIHGKDLAFSMNLTLVPGVVLSPNALNKVFGHWHSSPPNPPDYIPEVSYYYPNTKTGLLVTIDAVLTGPVHHRGTRIRSLSFERSDQEE